MSIFNGTIPQYVQGQIRVREAAKSDATNSNAASLIFNNAKTSWVRLSSSVDTTNSKGQITNTLASQYVLEGGTLQSRGNSFAMKSGIKDTIPGKTSGAYEMTSLGFRPMPGITNVTVTNKGYMGSLRQSTVTYNCWCIEDLNALEKLYMRPGYTCLLEWGNTHYIDNNTKKLIQNNKQIDIINTKQSYTQILGAIEKAKEATYGNYDAVFGYVVNFNYTSRPDGGWDCTTEIISMGSLLESMKLNYAAGTSVTNSTGQVIFNFGKSANKPLSDLIAKFYKQGKIIGLFRELLAPFYIPGANYKLNTDGEYFFKKIHQVRQLYFEHNQYVDPITNKNNKNRGMYYIPLEALVEIINEYILLRNKTSGMVLTKLSTIDKNGNPIKCVTHKVQTSIDPFTCIVLDTAKEHKVSYDVDGTVRDFIIKRPDLMTGKISDPIKYYYDSTYRTATIGNIYINIEYFLYIIQTNIDSETGSIDVYSGMKKLMTSVQSALGNINQFQLFIDPDDSVGRIVDHSYIEENSNQNKKFKMSTSGLATTVRKSSISSSIFPEAATMIAIAAQAANTDSTTGLDIDSLIRYNLGLVDRIIPTKSVPEHANNVNGRQTASKSEQIQNTVDELNRYSAEISKVTNFNESIITQQIEGLRVSLSGLLTTIKKVDTSITKRIHNFILPIKLSLEIDGISGMSIGEIFVVPQNEIPESYYNAKVGFIITKISHNFTGNDWVTSIETQTCILE